MDKSKQWLGLMVDGLFHSGDRKIIAREISSVFGKDLIETRYVCSEDMAESTGEYYLFVRCNNYPEHQERLVTSKAIKAVVPSVDSPYWFNNDEVNEFAGSAAKAREPGELYKGDMVQVTEGYLKNLYGVVGGKVSSDKYRVVFNFHLRRFSEILQVTNLVFITNVLKKDSSGFPSGGLNIANEHDQLCREKG